jgi:hypothetical protein
MLATNYYDTIYMLRNSLCAVTVDESIMINSSQTPAFLLQNLNKYSDLRGLIVKLDCLKTFYRIGKYLESFLDIPRLELDSYTNVMKDSDMLSMTPCPFIQHLYLKHLLLTNNALVYISYMHFQRSITLIWKLLMFVMLLPRY